MKLVEILEDGVPAEPVSVLPEVAKEVMNSTARQYASVGFSRPWVGYLAFADDRCVGTCAFKTAPRQHEVEIAYFTFPENEGRGIATQMARQLLNIAQRHAPTLTVTAQTLPVENASNTILKKLGFVFAGAVEHPEDGTVWEWKRSANAEIDLPIT
jgi:RimJ/RimL family protein N-acetyltransferase